MRRAVKCLEARHGAETVPRPGRSAFYALIDLLAAGGHTFGSAVTLRQTANRPKGGSVLVLDVRAADRIKLRGQVAFDAMREVCEALGWS